VRARLAERTAVADHLGEQDAETVAPQRVARDQDAALGVVVGERVHVVTGRGHRLPFELAGDEARPRRERVVIGR
jgi:hypothetical protein